MVEYKLINQPTGLSTRDQILYNRGIVVEDIPHYLALTDADILDPLLLDNIREGVQMLVRHISNNDKTLLYFDVDCDGYCSGAEMLNYLHQMFPTFTKSIQYITNDGKKHGLVLERIPEDTKFIIMPDAGSNDIEQCKVLQERGVDVLILD